MKHLQPELLAAAAEGQELAPAQRAHLAACPQCSAELAELCALLADLREVPTAPKTLHAETLRRIGLAPRREVGLSLRWGWAGGLLAAGVALLLTLPSPLQKTNCVVPGAAPRALGCKPARNAEGAKAAIAPNVEGQAAASAIEMPVESAALASAAEAEPALGQAPSDAPQAQGSARAEEGGPKATPGPRIDVFKLGTVRGNLLRPALGDRLSVEVQLDQAGLLQAQVLDLRGRVVADLMHAQAGPGMVQVSWDGQDAPSGAYQLKLAFDGHKETVKILLVR